MKIALCFSGQPRFVEECFDAINQNLIRANEGNQVDVFVHTWFSEEICERPLYINEFSSFSGGATIKIDAIERIKELYSPVSIEVDKPLECVPEQEICDAFIRWAIDGKNDFGMPAADFQRKKTESAYSIYYSVMRCNTLKRLEELRTGERYDVVVKMRFDNKLSRRLTFEGLDMSYIYSENLGKPHYEISDWINFSNSTNMDKMTSIFSNFEDVARHSVSRHNGWSCESLIKSACDMNGIQERAISIGSLIPSWGVYK